MFQAEHAAICARVTANSVTASPARYVTPLSPMRRGAFFPCIFRFSACSIEFGNALFDKALRRLFENLRYWSVEMAWVVQREPAAGPHTTHAMRGRHEHSNNRHEPHDQP